MKMLEYLEKTLRSVAGKFAVDIEIILNQFTTVLCKSYDPAVPKMLCIRILYELSRLGIINGVFDAPYLEMENGVIVVWVKEVPLAFQNFSLMAGQKIILPEISTKPKAIFLAIGGPSGSGKSSVIKELKQNFSTRILAPVSYTTRAKRADEINGADYYFVEASDITRYQNNLRFINFVEARGNWYWSDLLETFESVWKTPNAIYLSAITQVDEFLERRILYPQLKWIWLEASDEDLRLRLSRRGDVDISESLAHNDRLKNQNRSGIVSLGINTSDKKLSDIVAEIVAFIQNISSEVKV